MREGKLPGFTIVEFVIAVTVSVILVAVGVPRFNSFVQRQDFNAGLQTLASCIQKAQQDAIAPSANTSSSTTVRYMEARIIQAPSSFTATCEVSAYDAANVLIASIPVSTFTAEKLTLTTLTADGGSLITFNGSVQLFFGTLENGAPVILRNGAITLKEPPSVPYGRGFTFTLNALSSDISTVSGTLSMERLGTPVQISILN